jgi:[ribosomal protein S18]-alanine N-acetyltransferase
MSNESVRVHIRWMIRRDMPEVMAIEVAGFEFPWTEDEFLRHLRQRNCIGMVAEHGDRVVGFMVYTLHTGRIELPRLAVHPEVRRRRVGTAMAEKLRSKLSSHRRTRLTLNVRESSLDAQLFWRAVGFQATVVHREHYPDTGESAYQFEFVVPEEVLRFDGCET